MSENKEMKSLNGYEVVDAKAREDIATIQTTYATKKDIEEAMANIVDGEEVSY